MESRFKHTAEDIRRDIEATLISAGVLCRVFGRGKSDDSLKRKLLSGVDKYSKDGKKIQDAVGIRVVLYFSDDITIVHEVLCNKFRFREHDSVIDKPTGDAFSVTRYNLLFDCPDYYKDQFERALSTDLIGTTFEVQIRSVLSEGWHEVEHDLRYKQKQYWDGSDDLSRALNGIVATLETSEWGMRKIFDDLAYRHYKNRNWAAMMLLKLRMRLNDTIDCRIIDLLNSDIDLAKGFLRIDRLRIIKQFALSVPKPLLTIDSAIFIWNRDVLKHPGILEITPKLLMDKAPSELINEVW